MQTIEPRDTETVLKRDLPSNDGPATPGDRDASPDLDEARIRQALDKLSGGVSRSARTHGGPSASFSVGKPARHRYVQDGEVVVEHAAVPKRRGPEGSTQPAHDPRLAEAQAQLAAERTARERAERLLERAQTAVHELETRLGHSEAALRETRALSAKQEADIEALRASLAKRAARAEAAQAAPAREPEPVKWWLSSKPSPKPARRTTLKQ